MNGAIDFFDRQFQRQIEGADFALNPFEQSALPHLAGDVLDLGCGLGNLALAAARGACRMTALDGSPAAIARLKAAAAAEGLVIDARCMDLVQGEFGGAYDAVVAIGLLMFFPRTHAEALLQAVKESTKPGGVAIVNVLVEGTTYMAMFEPNHYTLFDAGAIERSFADWQIIDVRRDGFDAPGATRKEFVTVIARRPL